MKRFRTTSPEDGLGPDLLRIAERLHGKGYEMGYVRTSPIFVPVLHVRRDGNCAYVCRDTSDSGWLVVFACVPDPDYGRGLLVSTPGTYRDPQTDDEIIAALDLATRETFIADGRTFRNAREDTDAWRSPYFMKLPQSRQEVRA